MNRGASPTRANRDFRPDGAIIDPAFRYVHRLQVRFADLDALGHVNHAVYLTYVEQSRTMYFRDVLGLAVPDELRWVIATQRCDYLAPLAFADLVDVGWRITRVGRSSADFAFELGANARLAARGDGVLVWADPRAGRSIPIPEEVRRRMIDFDAIA